MRRLEATLGAFMAEMAKEELTPRVRLQDLEEAGKKYVNVHFKSPEFVP